MLLRYIICQRVVISKRIQYLYIAISYGQNHNNFVATAATRRLRGKQR